MLKCQFWKRDGKLIFPSGIRKTQDCPCPCFAIIAKCREDSLPDSTVNDYREGDLFVAEVRDICGKTYAGDQPVDRQIETYEGETRVFLTLRIAKKFRCADDANAALDKLENCQKSNIKYATCNQNDKLIMVRSRIDINCEIQYANSWEPFIYCGGYKEEIGIFTKFQLSGIFERCSTTATLSGMLQQYPPCSWSQSDLDFPFWKFVGSNDKGELPEGTQYLEYEMPNPGSAQITYLKRKEGDNLVYNGFYVTFPYLQGYAEACTGCESFGMGAEFNQPYSSIQWPEPIDYFVKKKIENDNSLYRKSPTCGTQQETMQLKIVNDYDDPEDLTNGTCNSYRSSKTGTRMSTVTITPLEDLWGESISPPAAAADPALTSTFFAPAAYADIYQQLSEGLQS